MNHHHHHPHCQNPYCQPAAIDALKETLHADYATIDEAAKLLKTSVPQLERFLKHTHREHDIRRVEAGLEKVGDMPLFIARKKTNGCYELKLYSTRPKSQWILRKNGERA